MTRTSAPGGIAGRAAEPRRASPAARDRIGGWQIGEVIADGAVMRLYAARPSDRPVDEPPRYVLKRLDERWYAERRAVALLQRTVALASDVVHRHLISILAHHVVEPPYYIVMPRLPGESLAQRIAGGRLPPTPVALWITRQVAEALAALNGAGWMHGDVKPRHVMVAADGHATLLDPGLARRPGEQVSAADCLIHGAVAHLAPELITSALRCDARSDVYGLGSTLFEMLAGRPPYPADGLIELVHMHRTSEAPDVRSVRPHVPREVAHLMRAMLAKQPEQRPQTYSELIERLVALEIVSFDDRLPA